MSIPSRKDLRVALLTILFVEKQVKPIKAYYSVAHMFKVSAKDRQETNENGESTFENAVRFTRQDLYDRGLVNCSDYGVWELTKLGKHQIMRTLLPVVE